MVFEPQNHSSEFKAVSSSGRLTLAGCLGIAAAFLEWKIARPFLFLWRRKPKKAYTAPTLAPLDQGTALDRLREAAANGNAQAKLMLTKYIDRSFE